jgi:pyridoxal 5'-phosphate synthase pdxS subunit
VSKSKGKNGNGNGAQRSDARSFEIKVGLAEMLKGGVIMDVTTPAQAKIAEDAGATAVMALERVPSDIRKEGGVGSSRASRRWFRFR